MRKGKGGWGDAGEERAGRGIQKVAGTERN